MLLSTEADIKTKNNDGYKAVHIAVIRGFKDILALLVVLHHPKTQAVDGEHVRPSHISANESTKPGTLCPPKVSNE